MAVKLHKNLKWFLIPVGAVLVVGLQLLMNGRAQKLAPHFFERFRPVNQVAIAGEPTVLALLKETLKSAQAHGKIAVVRFNLTNCGVCARVDRDVFSQAEWKKFAKERLEVTDYLMPNNFTDADKEIVQRMNLLEALAKTSGADQGFPFIAVLARDGSLLGARAGYHPGGADNYIKWVENLNKSDKSPTNAVPESVTQATNAPAETAKGTAVPTENNPVTEGIKPGLTNESPAMLEMAVKGVSGVGERKLVLLAVGKRNFPLIAGEKKRVITDKGITLVECVEIGDKAVVVRVEGEEQERRLPLPLE